MPEYLAPGVYVEEVDTGSKPIEGVSTSTCGVVGVAERGPIDVPVLVTSVGDYNRWFGGQLRPGDDYGEHRYLPHAVEGFFTNGGKRVYVVRALSDAATRARSDLFDRGEGTPFASTLVRSAGEGTGTSVAGPDLLVLAGGGLNAGDTVRIGEGSSAEYHEVATNPATEDVMVVLDLPLSRSHPDSEQAHQIVRTAGDTFTATAAVSAGDSTVAVQALTADLTALQTAATAGDACLELAAGGRTEYRLVSEVKDLTAAGGTDSTAQLVLDAPLTGDYPDTTAFTSLDLTVATVDDQDIDSAAAGTCLVFLVTRAGNFDTADNLVIVGDAADREVRRIGRLSTLDIAPGAAGDYGVGYVVDAVDFATRSLQSNAAIGDITIELRAGEAAGLVVGQALLVDSGGASPQPVTVTAVALATDVVTFIPALTDAAAANDLVAPAPKLTTATGTPGARTVVLDNRVGVSVGSILEVGSGSTSEIVTVTGVPGLTGVAPDAGNVAIDPALSGTHPVGTKAQLRGAATGAGGTTHVSAVAMSADEGATTLVVTDARAYGGHHLRVTSPAGTAYFHQLTAVVGVPTPDAFQVTTPLARSHPAGSVAVARASLFQVEALDAGVWGNRLRVTVTDDDPGLVSRTTLATLVNPTTIRLASRSGVQPGTVLELIDPAGGAVLGAPVKVRAVERATGNILLAGAGLAPSQQPIGTVVRSREFTLTISLLRQPDPATPSRDDQVIDRETFRSLSMDPRHSNYIEKVVGSTAGPLRSWDHRPEGGSLYVRVLDLAATQADKESARVGPEALVDRRPDGRLTPARTRLEAVPGDDSIGTLTDSHYLGTDNVDPEKRTGLQSLRNIEQVSLVAIPGQVGPAVQQGLIDHCELMRYRFAVMDTTPEPRDTITDAQEQRQQFDTKYAALYYPWLAIRDPFPENLADVHDYAIPPAGHLLGVYARTDIERGVHKAPANEVVRGIVGLRRKVNKEQQDILNPYPVNINVIRDFRDNNRGIRVYGARVITSDPDWKYVNVRRLLIFIEASIERGLQWVVFEPNSEPLWARVTRVITNFLTVVWRSGALEGTSPEEAFFVRCDRTTMTQTDVDNGRLIVQVGVAPVKPAEFVIVRIGLWTARSDS